MPAPELDKLLRLLVTVPESPLALVAQAIDVMDLPEGYDLSITVPDNNRMYVVRSTDAALTGTYMGPETPASRARVLCSEYRDGRVAAVPLADNGMTSAVLVLCAPEGREVTDDIVVHLTALLRIIGMRLDELRNSSQTAMIARLADASTVEETATRALELLLEYTSATGAVMLYPYHGRMRVVATAGEPLKEARNRTIGMDSAYPQGLAWQASLDGRQQVIGSSTPELPVTERHVTVIWPLGHGRAWRWVIVLRMPELEARQLLAGNVYNTLWLQLGSKLEQTHGTETLDAIVTLQQRIADSDTPGLFQLILETATRMVPGADAGSLLVRPTEDAPFTFRAMTGFDLSNFRTVELSEAQMRRWYELDDDAWYSGQVHLGSGSESVARRSIDASGPVIHNVDQLQSNICMPVSYQGEVLAVVNLDNLSYPDAFHADSVRALQQFAAPIAAMLAAARQRDHVQEAAHTDVLTGLRNRRGSDVALANELSRSRRSGQPFTLLVMDLRNFKQINDTYGHEAGDAALQEVARTLQECIRQSDSLARWGGDEFSAILPGVGTSERDAAVSRFRKAVQAICIGEVQLDVDVGAASYRIDGQTSSELMRRADSRMYASKNAARAVA